MFLHTQRWTKGACKLGRGCTFAHGDKELEAWNEHLEKMENEMKRETGKENKEQNDDSLEKTKGSDSPMKDKNCERAAPTYKVGCYEVKKHKTHDMYLL